MNYIALEAMIVAVLVISIFFTISWNTGTLLNVSVKTLFFVLSLWSAANVFVMLQ